MVNHIRLFASIILLSTLGLLSNPQQPESQTATGTSPIQERLVVFEAFMRQG